MVQSSMRIPICWLATLKSVGVRKKSDVSKIMREALELWAEKEGVKLEGY